MTWAEYNSLLGQIEAKLQRLRAIKAQFESQSRVAGGTAGGEVTASEGSQQLQPQPFERGIGTAVIDADVQTLGFEPVPYRRDDTRPPDKLTAGMMAAGEHAQEALIREQVDRIVNLGTAVEKPSETIMPLPGGGSADLRPVTDDEKLRLADVSETEAFLGSAINEAMLGIPEAFGDEGSTALLHRGEEVHPGPSAGGAFVGAALPTALSGAASRVALKPIISRLTRLGLNPKTVLGATAAAAGKLGMGVGTEAGTGAVYGTLRSLGSGETVPAEVAESALREAALFSLFGAAFGSASAASKYLGDLRAIVSAPEFEAGLRQTFGDTPQLREAERMLEKIKEAEPVAEPPTAEQLSLLQDRFPTGKRAREMQQGGVDRRGGSLDIVGGGKDAESVRRYDRVPDVEGVFETGSNRPSGGQIPRGTAPESIRRPDRGPDARRVHETRGDQPTRRTVSGREISVPAGEEPLGVDGGPAARATEAGIVKTDSKPGAEEAPGMAELHAGFNPFAVLRNSLRRMFGTPGSGEGRKLVNVLGTPEVVLKERGIVEPFIEAGEKMKARRNEFRERLKPVFEGVRKGSKEDVALFGKLDDPAIQLEGGERILREHFDGLLDEVNAARAVRGEKPILRRKGYITHLLDYAEEQSKLFDDGPQTLKFPFEVREGGAHRTSAIEATQVYTEAALREIYLADAVRQAVPKVEALAPRLGPIMTQRQVIGRDGKQYVETLYHFRERNPGTERNYAEQFIMRQLGWPSRMERAVEEVLGWSPRTQRKAAQMITAGFYRTLIGAALDTGVKNLTQGINTLAEFGLAPTLKGYAELLTASGRKVAKDARLLEDYEPLLYGGELKLGRGALKKFDDVVLSGPMRFAEFVNRGASYHAAMDVALKGGMAVEDAHVYALEMVRKLQFAYGKTHISPHVQSALVRPLFQFTSYPIKQAELMYRWATEGPEGQMKLLRYLATTGALVMGGKYEDLDMSGVFFDPFVMVDPESEGGTQLPFSEDRVKFSWDKLMRSGFVPQGPAPVISVPIKVVELALESDPKERKLKFDDLKRIVPNRYAAKLYEIHKDARRGYRETARGRRLVDVTPRDLILRALGFRSNEWERVKSQRQRVVEVEEYYYAQRRKFIDLALDGEGDKAREVFQELADKYPYLVPRFLKSITADALIDEAKKKRMTADERFYDNSLRETIRDQERRR